MEQKWNEINKGTKAKHHVYIYINKYIYAHNAFNVYLCIYITYIYTDR